MYFLALIFDAQNKKNVQLLIEPTEPFNKNDNKCKHD